MPRICAKRLVVTLVQGCIKHYLRCIRFCFRYDITAQLDDHALTVSVGKVGWQKSIFNSPQVILETPPEEEAVEE